MTYSSETVSKVLLAFLKLTEGDIEASPEEVAREAGVPSHVAEGVVKGLGRVEAALRALELGVDAERVARYLDWREFEAMVAEAFKRMGFEVMVDVKLRHGRERCQIDVLAYRPPLFLIIDCKHWRKPPSPSEEEAMVKAQERRLRILAESISLDGASELYILPAVLTLYKPSKVRMEGHLISPLSGLRSLIEYLQASYFKVRHIRVRAPSDASLRQLLTEKR